MRYLWAVIIGGVIVAMVAWWWMASSVGQSTGSASLAIRFNVASGQKLRRVAVALEQQHLIKSAGAWTLYTILQGQRSQIKSGDYMLDHGMSGRTILRTLTATNPLSDQEVTVKVLEGSTNQQIAKLLEKNEVIDAWDFLNAVNVTDSRQVIPKTYDFLADKPTTANLQGYLFPDTYRFFKHSTAAEVLQKFLDNFGNRVTSNLRLTAANQSRSIFEELTMASIVEAELQTDTDRAMGADVFWKRLKIGMPLQSDATVNYVTGKGKLQPSNADTQIDSPYNTYQHPGLPPGPINNPGLSAIRAAINPSSNPFFYYLTTPDGKTIFAKTLAEHNLNKQKYLR